MKVYLTKNDIERLAERKTFKYEQIIFKPSFRVVNMCQRILARPELLKVCKPVLEMDMITSIYLKLK